MFPWVDDMIPVISFNKLDLPDPLSPWTKILLSGIIENEMLFKIGTYLSGTL